MNKELATIKSYKITDPKEIVQMANVLKAHIVKHNLYVNIAGRNYVEVEGWQFAGGLVGLFPRVASTEDLSKTNETKWLAKVELVDSTDRVVATGIAVCSNKEQKKSRFDEYAILSMAQTRAIGKAYRNLLGWVMKMAGYEATPAEDMQEAKVVKEETPKESKETVDYKAKLYAEVLKMAGKDKMTGQQVLDFINAKLGTKAKAINGQGHAQQLLAQLLIKRK